MTYNGIELKDGDVIHVKDIKVKESGLYWCLGCKIGWISNGNAIIKNLKLVRG